MSKYQTARTIQQQITLDTWWAISARKPQATGDSLIVQYGKRSPAKRQIKITLTPADTYDVRVLYTPSRGRNRWKIEEQAIYHDVYADTLPELLRDINEEYGQ